MRLLLLAAAFVVFTGYTLYVMAGNGVLGFVTLAGREPWALQLFTDLLVMLTLFAAWVWRDAPQHKLARVPYVVVVLTMGSMGALAYLVHREIAARRMRGAPAAPR